MPKNQKHNRIIIIAAINLIVVYMLACTYLWARQSHFTFMPDREIKKTPVLYLHGTKDILVPAEMSHRLYQKTSSPKRLKFINGGGHNNSASIGGEDYLRSIREFEEFISQKS